MPNIVSSSEIMFTVKAVGYPAVASNGKKTKESQKHGTVVLHVDTIKMLNLHFGSPVVLHIENTKIVRTVRPSTKMRNDQVMLDSSIFKNYKINVGDDVTIHKFNGVYCCANKLELQPCSPFEFDISSQFKDYCSLHLESNFICLGEIIELSYYGNMKQFLVSLVASDEYGTCTYSDQKDLIKNFETLGLHGPPAGESSTVDTSYSNCSLKTTQNESNISLNVTDTSNYYSLVGDSISFTDDENQDNSCCESRLTTSTPIKKCDSWSSAVSSNCNYCGTGEPVYKISVSVTDLVFRENGRQKRMKTERREEPLSFTSIGGMNEQINILKEFIELPFAQRFMSYGLIPPIGILLYGPSGTGKTLLAKTLARESGFHLTTLNGPDILSRYYGETEEKLRVIFQDAQNNSPSIIFIDELDALCPKREKVQNEFEKRVVASLLTLMDGLSTNSSNRVLVIAATSRLDNVDSALRRPGRFEKEIEIGIPKSNERSDILYKLLNRVPHNLSSDQITKFAESAHGFVGADLMAIVKEASGISLRRFDKEKMSKSDVAEMGANYSLLISEEDIRRAFQNVQPSGLREIAVDIPKVYWNDIGGNEIVKQKLKQAIEWPLKHPEAFVRMGIEPPKGILMYGPPGCSKTLIAKALATESGLNFLAVKGPEIFSKWVGESERAIRQIFHKARAASPCVVFFDEIDAIASKRENSEGSNVSERVLTQLLTELDGCEALTDVTLVAATNRPDAIDKALMRPGRIDRIIYIPLPDFHTRSEIFHIHLRKTPLAENVDLHSVVMATEGYSGAEITALCREAALASLQEDINGRNVEQRHFLQALNTVKPRISSELIGLYTKFQEQCGIHCL